MRKFNKRQGRYDCKSIKFRAWLKHTKQEKLRTRRYYFLINYLIILVILYKKNKLIKILEKLFYDKLALARNLALQIMSKERENKSEIEEF